MTTSGHSERRTMWIGDVCRRPRALAAGIATSAAVSAGFGFAATPAMAAYGAQVSSGTLELVGDRASDKLSLELDPTDPSFLIVDVGEDGTVDFRFDRSTFSA